MPRDVTLAGQEVVDYAREIGAGKPYVLGTAGPDSYDCSGLILAVFEHFAIATYPSFPREAGAQARWLATHGQQISISAASATPGAVLAIDKGPSGGGAGGNHIGFCLSPGVSFEARSTHYGIGSWPLSDHKWTGAYLVPNVDYTPPHPQEEEVPYLIVGLTGYADLFACFASGAVRPMVLAEYTWLKDKVPTVIDSTPEGKARLCRLAGIPEASLTPSP
jgi:hypothetical protein